MKKRANNRVSGVSPPIAVLVIIGLIMGGSAMALLVSKREPATDATLNPQVARIERVEGEVGVVSADEGDDQQWTEATINAPVTAGDTIEARENSRATLAFTGRRFATLDPGAQLDVLALSDDRTQLALRDGTALFDLSDLGQGELFEVATPYGAVDFVEPGLYQVGYGDDGNAWVSVLSGLAQVVGLSGTGEIGAGEVLTLAAQVAAPLLLSKLAPELAGGIVDDYYGYRYPDLYDGRYRYYDRYLDDPFYYDPYRRSASYRYVNYDVPGL
ncbi:MAG TPA: FecR domain-containing protein, partial [Blastocatellia bacterium]|nr:FecR domain-containing protein [Blastocatellia bacterium]